MSDLTLTLLRYGFLALLWFFIFLVIVSQRRDLSIAGRPRRPLGGRKNQPASARQGSAARSRPSTLYVLDGPLMGQTFHLGDEPATLGRSPEATITLKDDYASGQHARLFPQGSRWFLQDSGSTNGTFMNGQRLTRPAPVEPGTSFRVGKTTFELRP